MALPNQKTERYTWTDYQSWPDAERWEIIGGEAFNMTPAPSTRHQHLLSNLAFELQPYFKKDQECRLWISPLDVRLSEEDVVQPDLLVVCDSNQIKRTHVEGPPTLVIEILSPQSAGHDHVRKFQLYAQHGVKEYWIVTPYPALIEVYILHEDHFRLADGYEKKDTLKSPAFPNLELKLETVFDFPLEPGEKINIVKETPPPYAPKPLK